MERLVCLGSSGLFAQCLLCKKKSLLLNEIHIERSMRLHSFICSIANWVCICFLYFLQTCYFLLIVFNFFKRECLSFQLHAKSGTHVDFCWLSFYLMFISRLFVIGGFFPNNVLTFVIVCFCQRFAGLANLSVSGKSAFYCKLVEFLTEQK